MRAGMRAGLTLFGFNPNLVRLRLVDPREINDRLQKLFQSQLGAIKTDAPIPTARRPAPVSIPTWCD